MWYIVIGLAVMYLMPSPPDAEGDKAAGAGGAAAGGRAAAGGGSKGAAAK